MLTDLKADAEILPVEPMKEDWLAHKVTELAVITNVSWDFYYTSLRQTFESQRKG